MFQRINDRSVSTWRISLSEIKQVTIDQFLKFLGIAFQNEQVISNKSIEVFLTCFTFIIITVLQAYKDSSDDYDEMYLVNIFDGFIQISFDVWADGTCTCFEIDRQDELEELNRAKKGKEGWNRTKMDVYPE